MGNFCNSSGTSMLKRERFCRSDFEVLEYLGKGGFAKVYRVRLRSTKRLFALKVIKKRTLNNLYAKSQAYTERDVLASISSLFIVKLYSSFQSNSKLFMVLEFLPGGTLFSLLRQKRHFSEDQARFYLAELLCALEDLHAQGIIYRDLKPENILLDSDGHLKLTDFNLAKVLGKNEQCNFAGTLEYLAPEVLRMEEQSTAIDFWALGVLLFEMVTGKTPFKSERKASSVEKILNRPVHFPGVFSDNIQDLIYKLLEKDPQQRIKRVRDHPFFQGLDWDRACNKLLVPPFSDLYYKKRHNYSTNSSEAECFEEYENFSFMYSP